MLGGGHPRAEVQSPGRPWALGIRARRAAEREDGQKGKCGDGDKGIQGGVGQAEAGEAEEGSAVRNSSRAGRRKATVWEWRCKEAAESKARAGKAGPGHPGRARSASRREKDWGVVKPPLQGPQPSLPNYERRGRAKTAAQRSASQGATELLGWRSGSPLTPTEGGLVEQGTWLGCPSWPTFAQGPPLLHSPQNRPLLGPGHPWEAAPHLTPDLFQPFAPRRGWGKAPLTRSP